MTPTGSRYQLILLRIVTESQQILQVATLEEFAPKYGCRNKRPFSELAAAGDVLKITGTEGFL